MRLVRILVTGGSGFVGLNVVEALLSAGIDVVSFDRRPMADPAVRAFRQLPGTLELVEGDIQDVRGVLAAARDTDAVIHGTAITPDDADEAALADLALPSMSAAPSMPFGPRPSRGFGAWSSSAPPRSTARMPRRPGCSTRT